MPLLRASLSVQVRTQKEMFSLCIITLNGAKIDAGYPPLEEFLRFMGFNGVSHPTRLFAFGFSAG
jgi:hypothetical protein